MLKLSKKVDYGLIAVMHLARYDDATSWSAREIAGRYGIPAGLLAKVLQRLAQEGLVASQHGTKGGYTLARPANRIRATEIIEAIAGPLSLTQCFSSHGACLQLDKCNIKTPLQRLNDNVVEMLSQLTIAQMVEQETKEASATEDIDNKPEGQSEQQLRVLQ
jgi:Rrf2 family protein